MNPTTLEDTNATTPNILSNIQTENPGQFQSSSLSSKRNQFMVDMRKEERLKVIQKRRMPVETKEEDPSQKLEKTWTHLVTLSNYDEMKEMITKILEIEFDLTKLEELAGIINQNTTDVYKLHYAIIGLRKLLSLQENNPVQEVID